MMRSAMTTQARTLTLEKHGQMYVFRYHPGEEDEVVDAIAHAAEDAHSNLDWLDAAKLSFQVIQHVASELQIAQS